LVSPKSGGATAQKLWNYYKNCRGVSVEAGRSFQLARSNHPPLRGRVKFSARKFWEGGLK
jgi:hypothetical protein